MARRAPPQRPIVEILLVATVVCAGLLVAAVIWMPEFQRGIHTVAADIEARWFAGDGGDQG